MNTKRHLRRSPAALLVGAALFASSAGASWGAAAASAGVFSGATTLAYDTRGVVARPSAQRGLAVYDRQYSRVSSSHGYYRHAYSGGYHGGYRYPYYRSYYRPYYYPYAYPYYGYGFGFGGYGYGFGYYGALGYPATYGYADWTPDSGALDLNIKPKRAEVWVDREYVGTVDSYDGFPRYLWLRSGEHHLVIYLDGYETVARDVTLRVGEVMPIRFDLREGVATTPDELFATLPPQQVSVRETPEESEETRPEPPSEDDWRASSRPPSRDQETVERSRVEVDQRSEPARLRLVVAPGDAVVYLDGRLLGSGEDLGRLHSDLLVDAGTHRLEVTRPGYRTFAREITVGDGEQLTVRAELESQ